MKIISGSKISEINDYSDFADKKKSLLDILSSEGFFVRSYCGGKGNCGKCKVNLIYKNGRTIEELACRTDATEAEIIECVEIPYYPQDESVVGFFGNKNGRKKTDNGVKESFGIAIDIGTTNIEAALVEIETCEIYGNAFTPNSQRMYGADVISRIEASESHTAELYALVTNDVLLCVEKLLVSTGVRSDEIVKLVVTGNTVMIGLLLKSDMHPFRAFPFNIEANFKESRIFSFGEIFSGNLLNTGTETIIPPCISAFIGADVYTGAMSLNLGGGNNLYVDIGTNCEILLSAGDKAYAASAAAGPAIEGAGISCGMTSADAAIKSVRYDPYRRFTVETIGGNKPTGLCGSGVLDAVVVLLSNGFIDSTGLLKQEYFKDGVEIAEGVSLTQKDIRSVQLAKSAIYTGVDMVIQESGLGYNDIQNVYLAGSFSTNIDMDSAFKIGLLPSALRKKVKPCGNCALKGAVNMLNMKKFGDSAIAAFPKGISEIMLAQSMDFQEGFIDNLNF